MDVGKDAVAVAASDRAATHGLDVRHMHLRPYRGLRVFQLLAGAYDVRFGEPGQEHWDIALPDVVVLAEAGKRRHEVVAMVKRHAESTPRLQFARFHVSLWLLVIRCPVQKQPPASANAARICSALAPDAISRCSRIRALSGSRWPARRSPRASRSFSDPGKLYVCRWTGPAPAREASTTGMLSASLSSTGTTLSGT